ncbi:ATP-binding protein [Streptomyces sp. NK15101]|uniref:ATP-binding protein n=1 Tax=Streptomyces sp. NK15101 TaxID=2873261 RepID=UPI001CEC6AA3|nr:ATP-binding protein [Streptomyces sp. NK15101]
MISEPSRYYAVELEALPSRIGQVRRIISAHLRHWQLDALVDHAVLGVTELLTNVHRHAQPDKGCRVEIELLLDRLTVSVRDHDPRLPEVRRTNAPVPVDDLDALATSGRGLGIVGAVSESWGVRPCGADGKVVWFTLTAPPLGDPVEECARAVYGAATEGLFAGVGYSRLPGVPLSSPAEPVPAPSLARPVLAGRAG